MILSVQVETDGARMLIVLCDSMCDGGVSESEIAAQSTFEIWSITTHISGINVYPEGYNDYTRALVSSAVDTCREYAELKRDLRMYQCETFEYAIAVDFSVAW